MRSALAGCLAVALALATAGARAGPPEGPIDEAAYTQHLHNGVKLYQDGNHEAAIVEFQAAYDAKPSANPLLDLALAYKAKFAYPKAIAALEKALEQHGGDLSAKDRSAAEQAVAEMRALLAYLTVRVSPHAATLTVDADAATLDATGQVTLPLGPGPHKLAAHAKGFADASASVSLTSGERTSTTLDLEPLEPPARPVAPDAKAPEPTPAEPPQPMRGPYGLVTAGLFSPVGGLSNLLTDLSVGGSAGLRVGYRFATPAAVELLFEYGDVAGDATPRGQEAKSSFDISQTRFGLNLRLMSPGRRLRFVSSIGPGIAYSALSFDKACEGCVAGRGGDVFFHTDLGLEAQMGGVLVGLSFDSDLGTSGGLSNAVDNALDAGFLARLGGGLHVGYAHW